jgi:hypothetical protein
MNSKSFLRNAYDYFDLMFIHPNGFKAKTIDMCKFLI